VSLEGRLRRLEEHGRGGFCPECGFTPDAERPFALIDEEHSEKWSFQGDPYEACASCGQPLHVVIHVVRDSSPSEAGDEGGGA
jgi:predicted RNA-binding Zn-ribbon protein involved in translation (DUF1610 family)